MPGLRDRERDPAYTVAPCRVCAMVNERTPIVLVAARSNGCRDLRLVLGEGQDRRGLGGSMFRPARGRLPVLFAIAALSLTRLATALATLLFFALGPFTVGLIAKTLTALTSLLAL